MNQTCKRGYDVAYEDLMDLIDRTFGFETPETQFLGLLPKLYKPEYRPQDSNYVVLSEDGKPIAAVGAYDHEVMIAGYRIPCRGIGNVAVHSEHRAHGYMKVTMDAALDDMVRDGIALSTLGGRRQRYRYFSYDRAGICHEFLLTEDNFRHTFGTLDAPYAARLVTDSADPVLDEIKALSDRQPFHPVRDRAHFLEITQTWHGVLCVVTDPATERFVGYAIVEKDGFIPEMHAVADSDVLPILRTLYAAIGRPTISLRLPDFATAALAAVAPVAEGMHTGCSMSYTVLNYALIVEATLTLKAGYAPLADGVRTFLIHGRGGDECLRITVESNRPTVEKLPPDTTVDAEWSHNEAMDILFAPFSPARNAARPCPADWLPLPVYMYRADEV